MLLYHELMVGYGVHTDILQDGASGRPSEMGLVLLEQQREESRDTDGSAPGSTEWKQVSMTIFHGRTILATLSPPSTEAANSTI